MLAEACLLLALFSSTRVLAATTGKPYVGAYYAGYSSLSPANIPYSSLSNINFFVATTTGNGGLSFSSTTDSIINATIAGAKKTNTSVSLTIGGWTGSAYFSYDVGNAANRTAFAKVINATVAHYGFSGVDIDWEYPGQQGNSGNVISPNDTANFALFLTTLRSVLGAKPIISLAVSVGGLRDANGNALTTYSSFLSSVDYLMLMNYDVWGPYGQGVSGPNAPLYACSAQTGNPFSAYQAVRYFTKAGWPASRLILGVPSYSHAFSTSGTSLTSTKCGTTTSYLYQSGPVSNTAAANALDESTFAALISGGYLNSAGTAGANGYTRVLDTNSSTPFLFNSKAEILISYDDAQSMGLKGTFAKQNGLAGLSMFELSGDTPTHTLLNAYRSAFLPSATTTTSSTTTVKTTATATSSKVTTSATPAAAVKRTLSRIAKRLAFAIIPAPSPGFAIIPITPSRSSPSQGVSIASVEHPTWRFGPLGSLLSQIAQELGSL
ncbi:glycoside hydrolase family 18 protein [Mixia osmundae IAM 14324]|uniref:GH18 domain-containing protein n=1 Tax=Mixia osmundae (strain CBS 9802 / IAM 14324 / JCM 22182 / KY 12970) TaxID=764103 RepID=G7DUP1_MIXOS|nr:glycoside hydrolase family 18 protein [Mixia osmundae IAM 14324]KEI37484.1 glycoside hydrolase family 18 protein [Mixia osmundae IAM 14324]GAA94301.1 hypothetical protein E5Q_00950 [Mixia osmundae IAM 14324]